MARGPGDYLHDAIVRRTGERPEMGCKCHDYIARMNSWGPERCRRRVRRIVGWLLVEARRRGWWRYVVQVPGARWFVRRLVLESIAEAEQEAQ